MKHPRKHKQEGAALFVVLMVIMAATASAVFAATTVSHELRGAGFARQEMQTRYAARAGLIGAFEWFDAFGPLVVRELLLTPGSTTGTVYPPCTSTSEAGCYPEPPLANNRRAYRIYREHFDALQTADAGAVFKTDPYDVSDANYSFGSSSALEPVVVVDLYDERIVSTLAPGTAGQGGTKFKYMRTTMTARARGRLKGNSDGTEGPDDGNRQRHETSADMRAHLISGPFITGSL